MNTFEAEIQKMILETFAIFDQNGTKTVDIREIGCIVRSLGCCPNEAELKDILAEVEEEDCAGYAHLNRFLPIMMRIITEHRYKASPGPSLLQAFQALDPSKNGYLTQEELTRFMTEEGEPFSKDEMDEMISVAANPETGHIHYKKFVENALSFT